MRTRFDGAPIVPRRDRDRVDAVHNALVVRGGPVWIHLGKLGGNDDAIARLLAQLFRVTETFEMETQPQLLLLQKTMLMAEGVGRTLAPQANMWSLAQPLIEQWERDYFGPEARIALARGLPLVAVNHLEGHAVSARLDADVPYPFLLLLVSGGHCQLLMV